MILLGLELFGGEFIVSASGYDCMGISAFIERISNLCEYGECGWRVWFLH